MIGLPLLSSSWTTAGSGGGKLEAWGQPLFNKDAGGAIGVEGCVSLGRGHCPGTAVSAGWQAAVGLAEVLVAVLARGPRPI